MTNNILKYKGITPDIANSVWIAHNAIVTGNVSIGQNSSVWFNAVIRGDANKIIIGESVNIQDHSMVHGTTGQRDTILGNYITIGHRAIIHGCTIHDHVLIGMGAIILDNAVIQSNVIVGAGAVVTEDSILESGHLYAGVPAKKIKAYDLDTIHQSIDASAKAYVEYASNYKHT